MSQHPKAPQYHQVLETAKRLYEQGPDWVTFFREVLGMEGIVRSSFTSQEELTEFERSNEYEQIQRLLVKLREQRNSADCESEPTRVITVRLPKSMHEFLRTEAHDLRTTMNKLCISKLLQVIGQDLVPQNNSEVVNEYLDEQRLRKRLRQEESERFRKLQQEFTELQSKLYEYASNFERTENLWDRSDRTVRVPK